MRRLILALAVLFLCGFFVQPQAVHACPACADAVPQGTGAEQADQQREASAYNFSIMLMAGMPFLLLTGCGIMVYRSVHRRADGSEA